MEGGAEKADGAGCRLSVVFSFRRCLYCSANEAGMKVGGGRVSTDGQREGKVKDNSPTQCDQSELSED